MIDTELLAIARKHRVTFKARCPCIATASAHAVVQPGSACSIYAYSAPGSDEAKQAATPQQRPSGGALQQRVERSVVINRELQTPFCRTAPTAFASASRDTRPRFSQRVRATAVTLLHAFHTRCFRAGVRRLGSALDEYLASRASSKNSNALRSKL